MDKRTLHLYGGAGSGDLLNIKAYAPGDGGQRDVPGTNM